MSQFRIRKSEMIIFGKRPVYQSDFPARCRKGRLGIRLNGKRKTDGNRRIGRIRQSNGKRRKIRFYPVSPEFKIQAVRNDRVSKHKRRPVVCRNKICIKATCRSNNSICHKQFFHLKPTVCILRMEQRYLVVF